MLLASRFNRQLNLINLLLDKLCFKLLINGNFTKAGMSNNHSIPIAISNTSHQLLTLTGFKILFTCYQDIGIRIKLQKLLTPLPHQMIRHNNHRLICQTHTAQFHCRSNHCERLACSDYMVKQSKILLRNPPHGILLRRTQTDNTIIHLAQQLQMTPIITLLYIRIKNVVIQTCQSITSSIILPNPISPSTLNCFHFLISRISFSLIKRSCVIIVSVINRKLLTIKRSRNHLTNAFIIRCKLS